MNTNILLGLFVLTFPYWWMVFDAFVLRLLGVKAPQDTEEGREKPVAAWISLAIMLVCWPGVAIHRSRYANHDRASDDDNPSWLARS